MQLKTLASVCYNEIRNLFFIFLMFIFYEKYIRFSRRHQRKEVFFCSVKVLYKNVKFISG